MRRARHSARQSRHGPPCHSPFGPRATPSMTGIRLCIEHLLWHRAVVQLVHGPRIGVPARARRNRESGVDFGFEDHLGRVRRVSRRGASPTTVDWAPGRRGASLSLSGDPGALVQDRYPGGQDRLCVLDSTDTRCHRKSGSMGRNSAKPTIWPSSRPTSTAPHPTTR